ncbi:hypothetical protein DB31_6939 [Hyalangium minutum]|uniref:Uncharacterized protein n=1 Tax=Hyalangium minutum TaxID=394096 RepID=A0A085WMX4_9BACT|nr:hypothetical protein DB31_6939 [Hyalangium minutum]
MGTVHFAPLLASLVRTCGDRTFDAACPQGQQHPSEQCEYVEAYGTHAGCHPFLPPRAVRP